MTTTATVAESDQALRHGTPPRNQRCSIPGDHHGTPQVFDDTGDRVIVHGWARSS